MRRLCVTHSDVLCDEERVGASITHLASQVITGGVLASRQRVEIFVRNKAEEAELQAELAELRALRDGNVRARRLALTALEEMDRRREEYYRTVKPLRDELADGQKEADHGD